MELQHNHKPDWHDDAQCQGASSLIFFPIMEEGNWAMLVSIAKSMCDRCVVKPQCLDYAIETNQKEGVWGGKTYKERKRLRVTAKGA